MKVKSGGEMAEQPKGTPKGWGKDNVKYWRGKIFRDAFTRDGQRIEASEYSVRLQRNGRREYFNLGSSNQDVAAAKAKEIYLFLLGHEWEETLARFKAKTEPQVAGCTSVGELLAEVKATAGYRPATFTTYSQCLRQIVAEIADIGDQPIVDEAGQPLRDKRNRILTRSRFDYKTGGREAWAAKVDAQPLSLLSPDAVQRWRIAYIAKAGSAPDAIRHAQNSASALIRNARSLFSEKALGHARQNLQLPDPLPFQGVKLEKRHSSRYVSKIDAPTLIELAKAELRGEPFKIFCLGLLCGLRKREIDTLLWRQVDFTDGVISIEATEHFHPKSEDSIGTVDLDPELIVLLRGWKAQASGVFVIDSPHIPRHDKSRTNYRCSQHFKTLYEWLRAKGITSRKPLHELRKELGAILASQEGIFAAQRALRHAQISTTAGYYTDKKRRITAGLGSLLAEDVKLIEFRSPPENTNEQGSAPEIPECSEFIGGPN